MHRLLHASIPLLLPVVPAAAQELRNAIVAAPQVVIGQHVGVRVLGDDYVLHTVRVEQTLRGAAHAELRVVEWKKLTFHERPMVGERRLYCLHPLADAAAELGIPERFAPLFRMDQHAGGHVPADADVRRLVAVLDQAQQGRSPAQVKDEVLELALEGGASVRREAAALLVERPSLLAALTALDLAAVLAHATAETDDVDYKVALATVCVERRMTEVVGALCISVPQIDDDGFARALGRFARHLHGDGAAEVLLPHLRSARNKAVRGRFALALGATSTPAALDALLRLRRLDPEDRAVAAALRLHGAPQAIEAVQRR